MLKHKNIAVGLVLAAALALSIPSWALAQCGGSGGGNSHMGEMGMMGPMTGHGQMGTDPPATPVPQTPNYVAPPSTPAPSHTGPGGQMRGPGGAGAGHSGHTEPTN